MTLAIPTILDEKHEAITLLRRLVEIESLSRQEAELALFLTDWMKQAGFARAWVDEAGNAVGEVGGGPRALVLLGHMDTVPGYIPVRIEGGKLFPRPALLVSQVVGMPSQLVTKAACWLILWRNNRLATPPARRIV